MYVCMYVWGDLARHLAVMSETLAKRGLVLRPVIYMCTCICMYVCVYIYICIGRSLSLYIYIYISSIYLYYINNHKL